jgi:exosome complex exonuclease DIS3/RRP44
MLRSKTYYKRTRRGKVLRVVEEHYLRDDTGVGSLHGRTLGPQDLLALMAQKAGEAGGRNVISVLDANVALQQLDFLENQGGVLGVVVILQTVVDKTRTESLAAYRRLRKLILDEARAFVYLANEHNSDTFVERGAGEAGDDFHDRAILVATGWLQRQLGDGAAVTLMTSERGGVEKARAAGVRVTTLNAFVQDVKPELLDLLAFPAEDSGVYAGMGGGPGAGFEPPAEHLPMSELTVGIKAGRYFQGTIRCQRDAWHECYVNVRGEWRMGVWDACARGVRVVSWR